MLENMHDVPYLCGQVGPEIVATMTHGGGFFKIGPYSHWVANSAAANLEALAIAHAAAVHFVRAEHFATPTSQTKA